MNPDLNAMLAEHEGFLRSCANDWLKVVGDAGFPDLLQEGRVALVLAARSYDPERGAMVEITEEGEALVRKLVEIARGEGKGGRES
jgi:DNA-directed RNA polymerase specialized sigma subunit